MISKSLYAIYIKEREGFEVLETCHSFILYKIKNDDCFISHAFTKVEFRKKHEMASLLLKLEELSLKRQCSKISASIDLRDKNASLTALASLKYGFKIVLAENGILIIEKSIAQINNDQGSSQYGND